jgi:prepilin-type N-terminal cleavage/methylation domain-containing protein
MKRTGFTLIELLVVIAIIAILAAILFPVFARARAKAQQSTCLANVKEIALSAIMYCSDNDDKWMCTNPVPSPCAGMGANWGGLWALQIYPYIKNNQIFVCPQGG